MSEEQDEVQADVPVKRTVPWLIIILGIVALGLAVIISTQVLGVLYVIIFPPQAPLPGDVTLTSHTNEDYGVDKWFYSTQQDACAIVQFYIANGGECRIAPFQCAVTNSDQEIVTADATPGQQVATCEGQSTASIFAWRWEANITTSKTPDAKAEFALTREMYWTGKVP
jgi:hypothetical protein